MGWDTCIFMPMRPLCIFLLLFLAGCHTVSPATNEACPTVPLPASISEEGVAEPQKDARYLAYSAKLIGLTEATAQKCLEAEEITWRVVSRDGRDFPVTKDFLSSRVNLHIVENLVGEVSIG